MTLKSTPAALNFKILLLQYPSAMKISPSEATAIEVGMQRWFLLEPGVRRCPNVKTGESSPGLN